MTSPGLLTDRYELTMLAAALADGTAHLQCTFEVYARRLPLGRRYGVVAGTGRVLDAIEEFSFSGDEIEWLAAVGAIDAATADFLGDYRFTGRVDGYPEGEVWFPGSPVLTVRSTFAEAMVLETVVLSIMNHDAAVAAAAARMVVAARARPVIEMGSRRTHEESAVAAARAAYLAGFASTSNLAAGRRHGVPTAGTMAHSFVLAHPDERAAFRSQVEHNGVGTTLLVDTYDITQGIANAVDVAGPGLGAVRIDSGELAILAQQVRDQLDSLGATGTRIVVSGDLDEYAIAGLAAAPVDVYGAGTAVVVGSGAPTAGFVYKLVEVDGRPVAKRSENKSTQGGTKEAVRLHRSTGTAIEEIVVVGSDEARRAAVASLQESSPGARPITTALLVDGRRTAAGDTTLDDGRSRLRAALGSLPWEGLALSQGDPALPTRTLTA